jgi:membrane associated rhomboid family serine protease
MIDISITNVLIAINVVLSLLAFGNQNLLSKFMMNPYQVVHRREYYRVISHAFIHADYIHLFFNMYVLYSFGNLIERIFTDEKVFNTLFPSLEFWGRSNGTLYFVLLYLGGILFSSLPAIKKHQNDPSYNSLGASGAVSAVVMAFILLLPTQNLQIIFIPIGIPAFILGGAYLAYEYYMSKRGRTGIAHDAHFYGALFGLVLLIILKPVFAMYFFYEIAAFLGIG